MFYSSASLSQYEWQAIAEIVNNAYAPPFLKDQLGYSNSDTTPYQHNID